MLATNRAEEEYHGFLRVDGQRASRPPAPSPLPLDLSIPKRNYCPRRPRASDALASILLRGRQPMSRD